MYILEYKEDLKKEIDNSGVHNDILMMFKQLHRTCFGQIHYPFSTDSKQTKQELKQLSDENES
jgi:hypothetical protein